MRALTTAALTVLMAFGISRSFASTASANPLAGNGYSSSYVGESVFENSAAGQSGQFSVIFFNDDLNGNPVVTGALAITVTNETPTLAMVTPSGALASTNGVLAVSVTSTTTRGQIAVSASSTSAITGCRVLMTSA